MGAVLTGALKAVKGSEEGPCVPSVAVCRSNRSLSLMGLFSEEGFLCARRSVQRLVDKKMGGLFTRI